VQHLGGPDAVQDLDAERAFQRLNSSPGSGSPAETHNRQRGEVVRDVLLREHRGVQRGDAEEHRGPGVVDPAIDEVRGRLVGDQDRAGAHPEGKGERVFPGRSVEQLAGGEASGRAGWRSRMARPYSSQQCGQSWCAWTAAFGRPVEPLVQSQNAGSSRVVAAVSTRRLRRLCQPALEAPVPGLADHQHPLHRPAIAEGRLDALD